MTNIAKPGSCDWTVADLLDRFGPISYRRVRQHPPPGTATEQDVIEINNRKEGLVELVDGVLVEKAVGIQESFVAVLIAALLKDFADKHKLGFVLGEAGMAHFAPGLVRIPDVSFVSWKRLPSRRVPRSAMLDFAPDLVVEVISPSNTAKEMERKLQDYFSAGVSVVWYVNPQAKDILAYSAVDDVRLLEGSDKLLGDPLLPGLVIFLDELFAQLEQ